MSKNKETPLDYDRMVDIPEDWKEPLPPVIIKRSLIKINFSDTAARTFGRFLIWTFIIGSIEFLIYVIIAGCVSAPGQIGVEIKETPITDEWGDGLTFYPGLIKVLIVVYLLIICCWLLNRKKGD